LRRASQLRREQSSRGHLQTQVMKTLTLIAALTAAALIIGQVGTARRVASEPRTKGLPMSLNVKPLQVLVRACGDCHSSHTEWPWYSHVPPVSRWIAQHVREGRERLDFSEWDTYSQWQRQDKLESICGLISTGRMPPWQYTTMHPEARLTAKDKEAVCAWAKDDAIVSK
jgi:Haem-binding domain